MAAVANSGSSGSDHSGRSTSNACAERLQLTILASRHLEVTQLSSLADVLAVAATRPNGALRILDALGGDAGSRPYGG